MRALEAAEIDAIAARSVVARNFVWVTARDRDTGDPETFGFWDDIGTVSVAVIDALTGSSVSRSFVGSGTVLKIDAIPLTSDISVRTVNIDLSPLHTTVESMLRTYDVRGAPVQVYRGYLDPGSRQLVAPPKARFVGSVDGAPITTPAEGGEAAARLKCVSTTRELTRTNPDVRSHASQQARHAGDDFYKDTAVVADWELFWGQKRGKVSDKSQTEERKWPRRR